MKFNEIRFQNHYLFGNLEIDFCDANHQALELIVLVGVNGTGKSTLLRELYDLFSIRQPGSSKERAKHLEDKNQILWSNTIVIEAISTGTSIVCSYSQAEKSVFSKTGLLSQFTRVPSTFMNSLLQGLISKNPSEQLLKQKLIYSPDLSFQEPYKPTNERYAYQYSFLNTIDAKTIRNVATYYMTMLDQYVYSNTDLTIEQAKTEYSEKVNLLLKDFELATHFSAREADVRLPVFRNKAGSTFDINGLSSGEKQLFCRYMAFKMVEPDNAIMLIDEPEYSLHPAWQQRVVSLYQKLGVNNQLIIATQSPHIIASVPKESLRFMELTGDAINPVKVSKWNDLDASDGMPAERVLEDLMGLQTTRDPIIAKEIEKLWEMVKYGDLDGDMFIHSFKKLSAKLDPLDKDMVLMRAQMKLRKSENSNVAHK